MGGGRYLSEPNRPDSLDTTNRKKGEVMGNKDESLLVKCSCGISFEPDPCTEKYMVRKRSEKGGVFLVVKCPYCGKEQNNKKENTMNERKRVIEEINSLSHLEMARLWRFAPSGHTFFDADLPYYKVFAARFTELGGMTPTVSKTIGW